MLSKVKGKVWGFWAGPKGTPVLCLRGGGRGHSLRFGDKKGKKSKRGVEDLPLQRKRLMEKKQTPTKKSKWGFNNGGEPQAPNHIFGGEKKP